MAGFSPLMTVYIIDFRSKGFREVFDIKTSIHISRIVLGTLRAIDITGGFSHAC
jgi:hypothetical protein